MAEGNRGRLPLLVQFYLLHVVVEALDGILNDFLEIVIVEFDEIVAAGEDALELGPIIHDIAAVLAAALERCVAVGNGLARGTTEAFGDGPHVIGRPVTAVQAQGLVGQGLGAVIVPCGKRLQGLDGVVKGVIGRNLHGFVQVALELRGAVVQVEQRHASVDIGRDNAVALIGKIGEFLVNHGGILWILAEFLQFLVHEERRIGIIAGFLHLPVQVIAVLFLFLCQLRLEVLNLVIGVDALLEIRIVNGGLNRRMDDERVVAVILRVLAVLDLHGLDADDFHLIIRQLQIPGFRVRAHVNTGLFRSVAHGVFAGAFLGCGDAVVFAHLVDTRRLYGLHPGQSHGGAEQQAAAEQRAAFYLR